MHYERSAPGGWQLDELRVKARADVMHAERSASGEWQLDEVTGQARGEKYTQEERHR